MSADAQTLDSSTTQAAMPVLPVATLSNSSWCGLSTLGLLSGVLLCAVSLKIISAIFQNTTADDTTGKSASCIAAFVMWIYGWFVIAFASSVASCMCNNPTGSASGSAGDEYLITTIDTFKSTKRLALLTWGYGFGCAVGVLLVLMILAACLRILAPSVSMMWSSTACGWVAKLVMYHTVSASLLWTLATPIVLLFSAPSALGSGSWRNDNTLLLGAIVILQVLVALVAMMIWRINTTPAAATVDDIVKLDSTGCLDAHLPRACLAKSFRDQFVDFPYAHSV
jgi:hypothetical protein